MYRNLKRRPELIFVKVSRITKNVVAAYSETGRVFKNINELKNYTKR